MHNFIFVPQKHGRYTVVSAGYTGGTTAIDVNKLIELQADADSTQPAPGGEAEAEIAWTKAHEPHSNTWSSYWYNGYIYVTTTIADSTCTACVTVLAPRRGSCQTSTHRPRWTSSTVALSGEAQRPTPEPAAALARYAQS